MAKKIILPIPVPLPPPFRRRRPPFPILPPVPVPPEITPLLFTNSGEYEIIQDGIVYDGKTGNPKSNLETGEIYT